MTPNVLVACEESQNVTKALRNAGVAAYSCDILPPSGGHPEWHYQTDVAEMLQYGWAAILAFPPCTHLAVSGARWFPEKQKDGRQQAGIDFFMLFANHSCPLVVIENPIGIMSTLWRKPDQIVQPYEFGDLYEKRTCLWLKGLPPLNPTHSPDPSSLPKGRISANGKRSTAWSVETWNLPKKDRARIRSITPEGTARAMAEQWAPIINGD